MRVRRDQRLSDGVSSFQDATLAFIVLIRRRIFLAQARRCSHVDQQGLSVVVVDNAKTK